MPQAVPPGYAPVFFVATHGGAGASTLAALAPGSGAVTRTWPVPPPDSDRVLRVLLVARSHYSGLTAAQHAITDWAAGSIPGVALLGLVVIPDAPGRLPRPLRELIGLVAGGVPALWQLPWSEPARLGQLDDPATAPREHRALLSDLHRLAPDLPAINAGPRTPTSSSKTASTATSAASPSGMPPAPVSASPAP